jgi:GWxTD domain-containing protein
MRLRFIIISLLYPIFGFSQLNFIPLSADYATFHMNDSLAYVEFYVSFFQNSLQYHNINDTLQASFSTTLSLQYEDSVYFRQSHKFVNSEVDTQKIKSYDSFIDIYKVALPFRKFVATVKLEDHLANSAGEYVLNLNIPGPPDHFTLSDIQLASSIKSSQEKSKFAKNNLEVIPHPRRTYDILNPMLYYYVELNNLSLANDTKNKYYFEYFVTDKNSDTVKTSNPKTSEIVGTDQAEIGSFNALSLPAGVYYLNIRARDNSSDVSSNIKKKFFVNKPVTRAAKVEEIKSEIDPMFSTMSKNELELEIAITKYISDRHEQEMIDQIDSLDAIKKFLTSFWNRRDELSGSAHGESHNSYINLVREANERFSHGSEDGWKTDRGRILIVYGHPDDIERYPYSDNAKPYSIWKYYKLDGGSDFVFYDRTGFGNYELLHSTYYRELQNPNWQEVIHGSSSNRY